VKTQDANCFKLQALTILNNTVHNRHDHSIIVTHEPILAIRNPDREMQPDARERSRWTSLPIHRVTSIAPTYLHQAINLRRYCAVCADLSRLSPSHPPRRTPLVRLCRGVRVSQRLRNLCLSRYLLLTFCILPS